MYQQSVCPACGAPIVFTPERSQVACGYCKSVLSPIQRGNIVTLELAEQVTKAVEMSAHATRIAVEETGRATQVELQRIQWSQELASLEAQLTHIQGEIRAVQRSPRGKRNNRQLVDLRSQEVDLLNRIHATNERLNPEVVVSHRAVEQDHGCFFHIMRLFVVFVVWIMVTAFIGATISSATGNNGGGSSIAALIGIFVAIYVFTKIK